MSTTVVTGFSTNFSFTKILNIILVFISFHPFFYQIFLQRNATKPLLQYNTEL